MEEVIDTLNSLIRLRTHTDQAINLITQSLTGDESVSEDDIITSIDGVHNAWEQYASLELTPTDITTDELIRMLRLDTTPVPVPERSRLTVIPGGRL